MGSAEVYDGTTFRLKARVHCLLARHDHTVGMCGVREQTERLSQRERRTVRLWNLTASLISVVTRLSGGPAVSGDGAAPSRATPAGAAAKQTRSSRLGPVRSSAPSARVAACSQRRRAPAEVPQQQLVVLDLGGRGVGGGRAALGAERRVSERGGRREGQQLLRVLWPPAAHARSG